jgi:hypothetical protein
MSRAWYALALLGAGVGACAGLAAAEADVDLAKSVPASATPAWAGMEVGQVLDAPRIERVVLTRAVTSTTAAHDIAGIRRWLGEAARLHFDDRGGARGFLHMGLQEAVWEAVVVMDDGQVFGYSADQAQVCLSSGDGGFGCVARPSTRGR